MTFVEVLPPERTGREFPEWFEARAKGVTASEIAAVMGLAPGQHSSAFKLFYQKQGVLGEDPDQRNTRWGRRLERHIADEFAEAHPEFWVMDAGLYAHADRPWQMASPDRLLFDTTWRFGDQPLAGLECKAWHAWDQWGEEGTDEVPIHIRCQAIWQADVLGVPAVYVPVANGPSFREYVVEHDEADAKLMREAALGFLDRIRRNDPPDVDGTPATIATLRALHPDLDDEEVRVPHGTAEAYRRACRSLTKAKARKALLEAQLRQRMGRARVAVDPHGHKVATRVIATVSEHVRAESTRDYLTLARERT